MTSPADPAARLRIPARPPTPRLAPAFAPLAIALAMLVCACGSESPDAASSPGRSEPKAGLPAAASSGGESDASPRSAANPRAARGVLREGPPNIIVITMDTTRADALGVYGSSRGATPRIDRLAREGVLFDQVSTSSPSTLPSHATIFTGKFPYAHGARSNVGYVLSEQNTTLAEVLRDGGYRTGAEIAAAVLQETSQIAQGFEHRRDPASPGVTLKQVVHRSDSEQTEYPIRIARDIAQSGIDFMREQRSQPFLLWLHFFDPHHPYGAPQEFLTRFPGQPYLAEAAYMDSQIGRVIDEIGRLGLREITLVVLTSDHGEAMGEHGERSHMHFVYQSTMRAPLIFWGLPELKAGLRVGSPVRTADIAPTLVDFANLPALEGIQGVSLREILAGRQSAIGLTSYGESIELSQTFDIAPLRFVREGRWKYIHKVNPELYDLETDPRELANLFATETERADALRDRMRSLLADAGPGPEDSRIAVDEATREQLVALGYTTPEETATIVDELATMELWGDDPSSKARDVGIISSSQGFILTGDFEQAYRSSSELLERNPGNGHALGLVGQSLAGLGRHEEAASHFRRAIARESGKPIHLRNLILSLEALAAGEELIDARMALLELRPCDAMGSDLAKELHGRKRYEDQIRLLARGAESCADSPEHLNNYAWALATLPDEEYRDGNEAVRTARLAISKLDGGPGPEYLDTLAVAYAEAGDFSEAIARGNEALAEAKSLGYPQVVLDILAQHVQSFREGRAVRE